MSSASSAYLSSVAARVDNPNHNSWQQSLDDQRELYQQQLSDAALPTHIRLLPLPFSSKMGQAQYESMSQVTHYAQQPQQRSRPMHMQKRPTATRRARPEPEQHQQQQHLSQEQQEAESSAATARANDEAAARAKQRTAAYSSLAHPHLLVSQSVLGELIHREMPQSRLMLVDVRVTSSTDGRCIRSDRLSQQQFDQAVGELEGPVEVDGAVSGLAQYRVGVLLYTAMRLTFRAHLTARSSSSVSPHDYINLLAQPAIEAATSDKQLNSSGPLSTLTDKPRPPAGTLDYFIQRQLETRQPERYRGPGRWTTGAKLLRQDVDELSDEHKSEMRQQYEAEQQAVVEWDRQFKQLWLDMADRQSPHVRSVVCSVDDESVHLRALYHLTASLALPVVSTGPSSSSAPAESRQYEQLLSFRVDEATILSASAANDSSDEGGKSADLIGPIDIVNGVRSLRVPSFLLSAIRTFQCDDEKDGIGRQGSRVTPTEDPDSFLAAVSQRLCCVPSSTNSLTISHVALGGFALDCGFRSPSATITYQLSDTLRLPCLDSAQLQPQPALEMRVRYQSSGAIDPSTYRFVLRGRLSSSPSRGTAAAVSVDISNTNDGQVALRCADGRQACALYDTLLAQSAWRPERQTDSSAVDNTSSNSSSLPPAPLPLTDCLVRYFPLLDIIDPCAADGASSGAVNTVRCGMDAAFQQIDFVLVERINLHLRNDMEGTDEPMLRVSLSSPPNPFRSAPKQRSLQLTPQLLLQQPQVDVTNNNNRPLQPARASTPKPISLRSWLRLSSLPCLATVPASLQSSIGIVGGTVTFRLDVNGRVEWQVGCAPCGNAAADVLVHYHNYTTSRATNITRQMGQVKSVSSELHSFLRIDQWQRINANHFPRLLDATRGRAVAPSFHYEECAMQPTDAVLDAAGVAAFSRFVLDVCEDCHKPGYQWLVNDTQRLIAHSGFVAVQPHLPYGRLLIDTAAAIAAHPAIAQQGALGPSAAAASESNSSTSSGSSTSSSKRVRLSGGGPHSLLLALLDMHGLTALLLDQLDSNSIIYGLCRVSRRARALTSDQTDYWHQHFNTRFAHYYYCTTDSSRDEQWTVAALQSWREQLIKRRQREQAAAAGSDKDETLPSAVHDWTRQSVYAASVFYAASVDLQCRFNAFQLRTMMQPPYLVLPQTVAQPDDQEEEEEDAAHIQPSVLRPPRVYGVPAALRSVLCITPPFCADLRPRYVGDVELLWGRSLSDCTLSALVPSAQPHPSRGPAAAAVELRPLFIPVMQARAGESDLAVWSLYTGPTYVWSGQRVPAAAAGVQVAVNSVADGVPSRPVEQLFVQSSDALLVTRLLPQLERHLQSYSHDLASCLQQKGVPAVVQRVQLRWLSMDAALDAERAAASIEEEEKVHRDQVEAYVHDEKENEQEESVVAEADGHLCLPLMNSLLAQYRSRLGRD